MSEQRRGPNNYVTRVMWKAPCEMPNGLQASDEGLWICDQIDPNTLLLVDFQNGDVLKEIPTRGLHGSGVTRDPHGRVWISSTFGFEIIGYDIESGREVACWPTPNRDIEAAPHGIEWHDGELWFTMSKTYSVCRMNPDNGKITATIPFKGDRPHGLAFNGDELWVGDTNRQVVFRLDPNDGTILDAIGVHGPEPHGFTIRNGQFWFSDAESGEVFRLDRRFTLEDEG
ncbi:MAG: hypothetical protein U0821_01670 [Chloroflexota bacterium]